MVPLSQDYFADKEFVKNYGIPYPPDMLLLDSKGRVYGELMMFHPAPRFLVWFQDMIRVYQGAETVERDFARKPTDGSAAARAARLFVARREHSRAAQAASRMEKLGYAGSDAAHTYQRVGDLFMNSGKYKEAIPLFRRSVGLAARVDEEAYAYLVLGYSYMGLKDVKNAEHYARLIPKLANVNPNLVNYGKGLLAEIEKAKKP